MNKYRITAHHIVFFIFIVSNIGGCLTPIGDPPVVPRLPQRRAVLVGGGTLLADVGGRVGGFARDVLCCGHAEFSAGAQGGARSMETAQETWRFRRRSNVFFLLVILGAVFINKPIVSARGIDDRRRGRVRISPRANPIHQANDFNFHPIKEVAILFIGIFATMIPALDWLQQNATQILGASPQPGIFYWGSGALSSVLDNAPTYLSFLSAIFGSVH
jgi:hypothetical protein